jgi:hypothetical protein
VRLDEVIALRQFELVKGAPEDGPHRCVFHTAFDLPGAPKAAEPRESCEYRVPVFRRPKDVHIGKEQVRY